MAEQDDAQDDVARRCARCREGRQRLDFDFTMAFQPIVDLPRRRVFAQEALARGLNGAGASEVLSWVTPENRYAFDQRCRVKVIEEASRIGLSDPVSINFMPNAVYEPAHCIKTTLAAAQRFGWPLEQIIFEFTENEPIDAAHLKRIFDEYKKIGFRIAIDDFGAGFAGVTWLADLRPDIVKLDQALIRGVDRDEGRRAIIRGLKRICDDLGSELVAEGVETPEELDALQDAGISLYQGFLFARPSLGAAVSIVWPPFVTAEDRATA